MNARRVLVAFAGVAIVGTLAELVMLRHWDSFEQVIPFLVLGALAGIAAIIWSSRPTPKALFVVLAISAAAALFGTWEHVESNHETAPLDAVYGPKWDSMSATSQWWAAANGSVGPSPPLVPLVMAYICAMLGTAAWVDRREPTPA